MFLCFMSSEILDSPVSMITKKLIEAVEKIALRMKQYFSTSELIIRGWTQKVREEMGIESDLEKINPKFLTDLQ